MACSSVDHSQRDSLYEKLLRHDYHGPRSAENRVTPLIWEKAMALTCPRCGTDVPSEALYCPYCILPKPKRGFTAVERISEPTRVAASARPQVTAGPQSAVSPRGTIRPRAAAVRAAKASYKPGRRTGPSSGKPPRQLRLSVVSAAALVTVLGVGIYMFVVPMVYSERAEPKVVLSALEKLRKSPSAEPNVSIDARLMREIETSRRVGNLVAYQGWTVRPIKGTKSKVVFAFAFVEVGDVHQSAEWIADLTNNSFTPQTELATSVYHGQQ